MYFNGKTYFNQDTNMRVVGDQRNPPRRRKGVRKKKVKKKGGKIDMKKLKSLFGGDIIVKLLLSLVDKQSRGPNLKSEGRKQLGEGKTKGKKMRRAKGGNFQTSAALKKERATEDKKRRVEVASVLKPGETETDVLQRLIKEIAVDGDPASLAFLKANTIPPELKKLIAKMSVYGEAFLDKDITPAKKKALERTIIKEVIGGVGGDVRKEFIKTATDDEDILEGFKEGVEALKKQGYTNAEKIIQNKDKIEEELIKKREKAKTTKEVEEAEKALTGLEVVNETGNTNTGNIEENITDEVIEKIQQKRGAKTQTDEKRIKILTDYVFKLNPDLEQNGPNKDFFSLFIEDGINSLATNASIKSKIKTQIGNLSNNKPLKKYDEGKKENTGPPKKTRADADIFSKGAIANQPDAYNITKPDGTNETYDGNLINPRIKYINKQIKRFEGGNPSDIGTRKELAKFKRDLDEERKIFRDQLKRISEGRPFIAEPGYSSFEITEEKAKDIPKLVEDLFTQGYYFAKPGEKADIKLDVDERIVGVGEDGISILTPQGFTRYLDYEQSKFRKQYNATEKKDATEKKQLRKLGIQPQEQSTELQSLIDKLDNKEGYIKGLLTEIEEENLAPRLRGDYKSVKKEAKKERKQAKRIADKAASTALSTGIGGGQLSISRFKAGQEGAVFNKKTGKPITKDELDADPFKAFETFDARTGETIDEEQAEELQDKQKITKYLEDYTPDELAELQQRPIQYNSLGNIDNPLDYIPRRPNTDAETEEEKLKKQDEQNKLIELYRVDKSVLKDIKLPGRKKLTQQGLYTLTPTELQSMESKQRKKFEAIIATRKNMIQSQYGPGEKEVADNLLLLRTQGKELTTEELSKISIADRRAQGLLTKEEVDDIKDKKNKKEYLNRKKRIEQQIEAVKVRDRKEIVDDYVLEGADFDRAKEQAKFTGQSRADLIREERLDVGDGAPGEILPDFAFRSDTPPRRKKQGTPARRKKVSGVDNSIDEQGNQQNSLDAAGPRRKQIRKKLEDVGIDPDAKSTNEELPLLDFSLRKGSDSDEDQDGSGVGSFKFKDDDASDDDYEGGDGNYLLES